MILSFAATAQAQRPPTLGDGAPSGQSGIQLYNFNNYLGGSATQPGAGEIVCPAPPAAATPNCVGPPAPLGTPAKLERVFAFLQSKGIRNVELYGYNGNPFPGTNPDTALNLDGLKALRALGDRYGIHFPGRHGNITEANWDKQIQASKILGQDHIGEAGFPVEPRHTTRGKGAMNTATLLNRLGKRSVEAGLGPVVLPQPPAGVPGPLRGQRRAEERLGIHHGAHRSALRHGADRHRLGRLRARVPHGADV